jgi:hypothetical protein
MAGTSTPPAVAQLAQALDAVERFLAGGGDGSVLTMTTMLRQSQRLEGLTLRHCARSRRSTCPETGWSTTPTACTTSSRSPPGAPT